jgi:hypothetical protein
MNGNKLIYTILAGLAVLGIAAGVNLAIAQGKLETRATTTESVQAAHSEVIVDVPVIANEIAHIKGDIADIKATQGKIFDAIKALEKD